MSESGGAGDVRPPATAQTPDLLKNKQDIDLRKSLLVHNSELISSNDGINEEPISSKCDTITSTHSTAIAHVSIRQRFHELLSDIFDFSLLRNIQFLVYCTCTFMMNFGMPTFHVHAPSRALHYGISPNVIAIFPSLIGLSTLVSRFTFGFISDCACVNRRIQYGAGIILSSLVEITFIFCITFPWMLLHSVMFGLMNGKHV